MSFSDHQDRSSIPIDENDPLHNLDPNLIALAMHKLSIQDTDVTDVLTDCEIYLNKLNRYEIYEAAKLMDLNLIFDCLNTIDEKQISVSCALLQKLLTVLPSKYAFNKYAVSVGRSLNHPSDIVKENILKALNVILTANINVDVNEDLTCIIVDCLKHEDVSVSCNATKCLQHFQSMKIISSPPVLSKLQSIMSINANMRSRVYELLIYWSIQSVDALALISSKGLFSNLVEDITGQDTVMQIVTIEMLIPLSIIEYGFDYLNTLGVVSGLYRLLSSYQQETLTSPVILYPNALGFFIEVTLVRPQFIYTSYPKVFFIIYDILKQVDDSLIGNAISGIISLASSWDCKLVLDIPFPDITYHIQVERNLDMWSSFIIELSHIASGNKPDLRTEAIRAITQIIQIEDANNVTKSNMMERTHKWYCQMKEDPIKMISQAIVLPFFDIKMAGLEMLLVLARQPWGLEEINRNPIILDTVIKNCPNDPISTRQLKKAILTTLSESSTAEDMFTENRLSQIRNVIQANINSTQPEVSIEDVAM